ncbi:MAG TPA: LysR family transcriptional regulator [Bdellovibrionales bacterium]|nr:LysR family transcriptional regulator [Bdellovibrionales bacterium]
MDLNEIAIFVKVVRAGTFSRAAEQLGMPVSTVSAKVAALESRLGVSLLTRTTRRLSITQAGQAFFDRAVKGLDELQNAEQELSASAAEPKGVLRITAPWLIGSTLLPAVIHKFTERYPSMTIDARLSDQYVDLVNEGVDIAIRVGELKDSSLIAKKIGSSCFALYASRAYLKKAGTPAVPKELTEHRGLHFTGLRESTWSLVHSGKKVEVALKDPLQSNDLHLLREVAVSGGGIALLPVFMCDGEAAEKKLVRVLEDWRSEIRPVHFVYPGRKFVPPKVHAFIELAGEILKPRLG